MRWAPAGGGAVGRVVDRALAAPASQSTITSTAASPGRLLVDGARHPDRISDEDAIRLLLRSLAAGAEDWHHPANEARMGSLGLSSGDLHAIRQELAALRQVTRELQESATAARAAALTAESGTQLREAWYAIEAAPLEAYERLQTVMSADGWVKLQEYIQHQKRNIRIFAPVPSAANGR